MKNINKFDGMFSMIWFYYIYKNLLNEAYSESENSLFETIMTRFAYLSIFYFLFRVSKTSYTWYQESNFKNFKQLAEENYRNKKYDLAKINYEKVLKYGSDDYVEYSLGWLYEHGQGVEKNLAKAKYWYQLAKEHGLFNATKQLVLIEEGPKVGCNSLVTETWSSIGNKYFSDKDRIKNYENARICYEQGANNETDGIAEYNMGLLYEHGLEVKVNLDLALDWFKKSLSKGYQKSAERIFTIEMDKVSSSQQAYELGEEYYYGKKRELNYSYARKCYEKALTFDFHIESVYSLGWLFHHGRGTEADLNAAFALYAHAALKGHKGAATQLKKIKERKLCRKQAKEYHNSASWLLWELSLFDTSSLVENIATTFILPFVDFGANTIGQPWISTTASYITLGVSFSANPFSFTARKVTSAVLYKIIDNLELTNPGAEATLMLLADYSSCFVASKITSLILDPKVVLEEKDANNNGNSNNKNSEDVDNEINRNSNNETLKEVDNIINRNSSPSIFNVNSQIFRQTEEDVVEVFYFGQPLVNKFFRVFKNIDKKAIHAGIILKDANGYTKIELALDKHKESRLSVTTTTILEIQEGNALNNMWIYKAGTTNLNSSEVIGHADEWIKNHPNYKFYSDNCRSLTDDLLRHSIIDNGEKYRDKSVKINTHNFKKSPCKECEHRIEKEGTNFHK